MNIKDYDIIKTKDDLWFYANNSVKKGNGAFGYLKYASCDKSKSAKVIDGIPVSRIWSKNPDYFKEEIAGRVNKYRYENIGEAKFFVPFEQIDKVYSAQEAAQRMLKVDHFESAGEINCRQFLDHILSLGVPKNEIGLIGSYLLGTSSADSDIDIILSSQDSFKKVWNAFATNPGKNIKFKSLNEWKNYEIYGVRVGLDKETYARHNERKFDRGYFNNTEFSIVGRNPNVPLFEDKKGEIILPSANVEGVVADGKQMAFLPSVHGVEIEKSDVEMPKRISLVNFDREYAFQVFPGERFAARGKLIRHEQKYYLITGPSQRPNGILASDSPLEKKLL